MNEDLILLEKLQDILDDLDFIVESDIETSARLKLMEVISELDMKISNFEEWTDAQGKKNDYVPIEEQHLQFYYLRLNFSLFDQRHQEKYLEHNQHINF